MNATVRLPRAAGLLLVVTFWWCGLTVPAQIVTVFPFANVWKYHDAGVDLSGQFQQPGYDDSSWPSGPGLLYVETAPLPQPKLTPLTPGRIAYYFRTKFNLPTNRSDVTLIASNIIDDGAVIYLNGAEMTRIGMPPPPAGITYNTLSDRIIDNAVTYDLVTLTNVTLALTDNVLAVEVHQQSAGSSDIVFGMSLTAIIPMAPTLVDASQPSNRIVLRHQSSTLSVEALATPPVSYQWFFKEGTNASGSFNARPDATNSTYTIADMSPLAEGWYYALVSNPSGTVTSRVGVVRYSEDLDPPLLVRAVGSDGLDQAVVEFNEPLDPGTAADMFNFQISHGATPLQVLSAALSPDGRSVILSTGSQLENTLYQVTVDNVRDLTGQNVIAEGSAAQFRSWSRAGSGGLLFEVYSVGGGSDAVFSLTSHPDFPTNPADRHRLTRFDTREAYAGDEHDGYGGRIRGLFLPPVSGEWKFYLRSDGSSELWMNTNGPSPSGRGLVAEETACCNPFVEDTVSGRLTSRPIRLTAGQPYYIEALYKEYAGADYCQVAAKLAADPTPVNALEPIPGNLLGVGAAPPGVVGPAVLLQSPFSRTNLENTVARFQVSASNQVTAPIWYQWRRDGADIAGATASEYAFQVTLADDGARFSCLVSVVGHSLLSEEAILTVQRDTVPPLCIGARGARSVTDLILSFSEPMHREAAENRFNYTVTGFTVTQVLLDASGTNVWLTIDPPPSLGSTVEVFVSGLTDRVGNRLGSEFSRVAVPVYVLTCGYAALELYFGIGGVAVGDLRNAASFPRMPDRVSYVSLLEGPFNQFDNYGARITGWLLPPVSGAYHFWMSSQDNGEFWLSADEDRTNLRLIAYEPQWNGSRDWLGLTRRNGDAPENRSTSLFPDGILLQAGRRYHFEALMKASLANENLAVAWQIPGSPPPVLGSTPIPGAYLATLADPVADAAFSAGSRLQITPIGKQLRLTWTCPGFHLQRNSDLGNVAGWRNVPGGEVSPVVIDVANASEFFRLIW